MKRHPKLMRLLIRRVLLALTLAGTGALFFEIQTSQLQAAVFTWLARDMTFWLEPGPNPAIRFPASGPYNKRLGYTGLRSFIDSLAASNITVQQQARPSENLLSFMRHGGFAIYREKSHAGLTIADRNRAPIFANRFPERVYTGFEKIPPVLVDTLLFIENRELLDASYPNRNPAVEWDRLVIAFARLLSRAGDPSHNSPGGSTLATQMEKYRHSPDGRTADAKEKLRQMASASIRAYLDGVDTTEARRRIVVDYLNSTPLAGRRGFGEIIGLGDGLWAWYGTDAEVASAVLRTPPRDAHDLKRRALVYKQALSLLLAQRRPAVYLTRDLEALQKLTDSYLRLLGSAGVIGSALRDAALQTSLRLADAPPAPTAISFVDRKAANSIRERLLSLLHLSSLYQLDRLDLTVETTFDNPTQKRVTEVLHGLRDRSSVQSLGLSGANLVGPADPGRIVYSFALYERGSDANYVRVQTDSLDQPFDMNDGSKLDLGSTAKLRTLISYLEIVAELHGRYAHLTPPELDAIASDAPDRLTRWTLRRLSAATDRSLIPLLEAALLRRYSASPAERFFTGGGIHTFSNFSKADDGRVISVAEAFRRSVNLVFIRLMRDIVTYHLAEGEPRARDILQDVDHPARQLYLARFAEREGSIFLNRFYDAYQGLTGEEMLDRLASRARPTPTALTIVFRSVRAQGDPKELAGFLRHRLPRRSLDKARLAGLYSWYTADHLSLADRGFIAGVHPLELWLVGFLQAHPDVTRAQTLTAGVATRQASYGWLFKSRRKGAQDRRIRIVLEQDAFERIHRGWQKLGYPFKGLTPSYATAIGSSADRPAALAELMGIILNDGVRLPTVRIRRLHFAAATPYETVMEQTPRPGVRVLPPEVAAIVRQAMIDVVGRGTGRRLRGAFVDSAGLALTVGGKTGTGDNRYERYAAGGRLIESRVVGRSATLVFFIGDRFFGTITAYVGGPEAARYRFTSALPSQLLKVLAPALRSLLDRRQSPTTKVAALSR